MLKYKAVKNYKQQTLNVVDMYFRTCVVNEATKRWLADYLHQLAIERDVRFNISIDYRISKRLPDGVILLLDSQDEIVDVYFCEV